MTGIEEVRTIERDTPSFEIKSGQGEGKDIPQGEVPGVSATTTANLESLFDSETKEPSSEGGAREVVMVPIIEKEDIGGSDDKKVAERVKNPLGNIKRMGIKDSLYWNTIRSEGVSA